MISEPKQPKHFPDWAKGGILGALTYLLPTGFVLVYPYISSDSGNPIAVFCFAAMRFWWDMPVMLLTFFDIHLSINEDGIVLPMLILFSTLVWWLLGALLAKHLGFRKGRKVLLVLEIGAFFILGVFYYLAYVVFFVD